MGLWTQILTNLPEVAGPTQKFLSFKEKLKWTLTILVIFFILGLMPLFGLGSNALSRFEYLSVILAADFGSLITLGIGPIVTASIVLQLLQGSGIIHFDTSSAEGKKKFQGTQKLLTVFFVIFEACIYVFMGGLSPAGFAPGVDPGTGIFFLLELILIFQITLGGILIIFMDEVVSKWGFGSGISLFIVAGVAQSIMVRLFSPLASPLNPNVPTGIIPLLFKSLASGEATVAVLGIGAIAATLFVFAIATYIQSMKVEIPLSFGRVRGHGIRWPLSFTYANVLPVILVSALLANIQLLSRLLQNFAVKSTSSVMNFISVYILGQVETAKAGHGIIQFASGPGGQEGLIGMIIRQGSFAIGLEPYMQAMGYMLLMVIGCVIFSIFWVQTSGMDAGSQAKNIMNSGLQVAGFRRDQRVLERLLGRYISPLTVMGGATIGFLAAIADLTGALAGGTALMLAVMITYQLYEEIAKQHMMDMHPTMRKFIQI